MSPNHAPAGCPVCGDHLHLTRLGCPSCGTELSGDFQTCEFCALPGVDLELLRRFLACRGNLKAMERQLGLSYPTVRSRVDAVLERLGLSEEGQREDPTRIELLQALARGDLGVEEASERLSS